MSNHALFHMSEIEIFCKELKRKRLNAIKRKKEYERMIQQQERKLEILNKLIANLEQVKEVEK